jgi:uncharacterized surface protein with fasciclin (FAS1) repeats
MAPAQDMDIVETAVSAGSFETLVAAVEAAGLVDTLKGEGPFTVFAPTDAAFEALPDGTVEGLLADTEALTSVLTYHVVPANVPSSELAGRTVTARTVNGERLTIDGRGSSVTVDGATVVQADVEASNGVIHVIDSVLMPEN